jgi:hypothetical protein
VQTPARIGAPFDPGWLDTLTVGCSTLSATHPRFEDLYLERRLEVRVASGDEIASCRSEGSAVRWRFPSRWTMRASSGASSTIVERLISTFADRVALPPSPAVSIRRGVGWTGRDPLSGRAPTLGSCFAILPGARSLCEATAGGA